MLYAVDAEKVGNVNQVLDNIRNNNNYHIVFISRMTQRQTNFVISTDFFTSVVTIIVFKNLNVKNIYTQIHMIRSNMTGHDIFHAVCCNQCVFRHTSNDMILQYLCRSFLFLMIVEQETLTNSKFVLHSEYSYI
jgi:hypothetical protein